MLCKMSWSGLRSCKQCVPRCCCFFFLHLRLVFHLCASSGLGVKLYEEKLPIDPHTYKTARDFNLDPTLCVLSGGEDYELLFTIPIADHDKIKANPNLTVIGYVKEGTGANLIMRDEKVIALKAQGFNHME